MRSIVTGAVAALALAITAGTTSAQHASGHGDSRSYVPSYPAHVAPAHYPSGGHLVQPGWGNGFGVYPGPAYGPGFYPRPAHTPVYPVAPGYGHGYVSPHGGHR